MDYQESRRVFSVLYKTSTLVFSRFQYGELSYSGQFLEICIFGNYAIRKRNPNDIFIY